MKHLILSDLHFGVKTDDFFINYQKNYLLSLIEIIKEYNIENIIVTGDINDKRKITDNRILNIFKDIFNEIERQTNIGYIAIVGNHDMYYKNSHKYNSVGNFFSDNLKHLSIVDQCYKYKNMVFVPWITTDNYEYVSEFISKHNSKDNYLFGHFALKGFKMTGNYTCKKSQIFKSDYENYAKVFSGHFHNQQEKDNILYVGNPWQTNFGELEKKGCWIFDNDSGEIEFMENKNNLFEKHFIKDNEDLQGIEKKLLTITNKYVKIYIDSIDNKYINSIDMIIEKLKPKEVDTSIKDLDLEIDEDVDFSIVENVDKEYFNQLKIENKKVLQELFKNYEIRNEMED